MQKTAEAVWVFEWLDYCSTETQIEAPVTLNKVFNAAKRAGWHVYKCDKQHYRVVELDNGDFDFQTEMPAWNAPDVWEWRSIQILKRKP